MVAASEFYSEHADEVFGWLDGTRKPPREALVEGPAGTGKTHTDLQFFHKYGVKFPGSKIVFLRNERTTMSETVLVEWEERILGPDHYAVKGGPQRAHREKYVLDNGTEYLCRGFDNETKLFSGQAHAVFFNEATDLGSEQKFETLHRMVRAPLVHPGQFRVIVTEVNPRDEGNWLNIRATPPRSGGPARMMRIPTYLSDNPRWYDHERQEWTKDGLDYIGNLSAGLSGASRDNLLLGLWRNASGAVLPQFQAGTHILAATYDHEKRLLTVEGWERPVEIMWTFGAMDCGYEDSGVFGVWGVDRLGRMFELAEVYRSHWTHQDWVTRITALTREYRLQMMVSDHDKALIEALNRALLTNSASPFARIADKTLGLSGTRGKDARIEILRMRLHRNEIFFVANPANEPDPRLVALGRPTATVDELPRLRYEDYVYGEDKVSDASKIDGRTPDHGFDMTLYACSFAASRAVMMDPEAAKPVPGTARAIFGPKPWELARKRA